jgi:hypothetical protein
LALAGYFDDVGLPREPRLSGVAGFLFEWDGVFRFNENWGPRLARLSKPYRTATCFSRASPFDSWASEDCELLMKDLANLIADTRDAGFVAAVELSEYNDFVDKNPAARATIGHPYTLSLLVLVGSVVEYMQATFPNEKVHLFFEKGDSAPEDEADGFLRRACASWEQIGVSVIEGYSFVPKKKHPALCAADFLAWEWQRNYWEKADNEKRGEPAGPAVD